MALSIFRKSKKVGDWINDDPIDEQAEPITLEETAGSMVLTDLAGFTEPDGIAELSEELIEIDNQLVHEFPVETTSIKNKDQVKKKVKKNTVNPIDVGVGLFKRLIGEWPLLDAPPLTKKDLEKLLNTRPAFVDYFPFVDFDPKHRVFIMNDGRSCGAVFDVIAPDLDARIQDDINEFCDHLNNALLSATPTSDEAPYVMQIYLEDRQPKNIASELREKAKKAMQDHPYGHAYFDAMEEHFEMMANPEGIFVDDRTTGETKGWRAIERKLTLVIFRKASSVIWNRRPNKRISTFEQFNRDIKGFIEGLNALDIRLTRYNESDFHEWLTPWFNPNPVGSNLTSVDWLEKNPIPKEDEERGFAWDLAQMICPEPPAKIKEEDAERGIMKFGDEYSRYISLQPIYAAPRQGCYTTDVPARGDSTSIKASAWDRMPSQSIQVWTIIPLSTHFVRKKLQALDERCNQDKTSSAKTLKKQIDPAQEKLTVGTQRIFYYQVGVYVRANSIEQLDEKYHLALSSLQASNTMRPIREEHELFATDSYIRNMPFVFDWQHDRKHALRASMAYSSHVAATLPFYGRSRGSKNPCFVNYNRSGEVIRINPYHPEDKSRVAHSGLFGPTGAGKSATQVAQAMASMAINFPRQFFVDKGGSFALLADYYERLGLKVKRIYFQTSEDICLPPFAETKMALKQSRGKLVYNKDEEDEEKRDYLAEMFNATILMVTGGQQKELDNLNNQDRAYLQEAIIEALVRSEDRQQKHARPSDLVETLNELSDREWERDDVLGRRIKQLADMVSLWTKGTRGHFFDRYGDGFDDQYDVHILELGVLTSESSEDMLAVAMTALLSAITQMGEKHQYSGREIEVYMDECHYVTANPLLVDSVVVGVKTWRKISIWLNLATQNITDFPDHAGKILDLLEFWTLLTMKPAEATKIQQLLELSDESQRLIKQCKKSAPFYVEGVMLSDKFKPMLMRYVPPAICLALGMTDGKEKEMIQKICTEQGISKLDAAIQISQDIIKKRRTFSPDYFEQGI